MDIKSIIEVDLQPLNEEEMKHIEKSYNQDFSKMTPKNAVKIFKMLMVVNKGSLDDELFHLLTRRLNMIVDFKANPELLI